jgi:hypothetical protein
MIMIIQASREESMSRTRLFNRQTRFRVDRKKARQVKRKSKSMLIIFFDIKGDCSQRIRHNRLSSQFRILQ